VSCLSHTHFLSLTKGRENVAGYASVHRPHRWESRRSPLQHTATNCNRLQHSAAHCSTLQQTICLASLAHTHRRCQCTSSASSRRSSILTATHCNTLQHSATHCFIHFVLLLSLSHTRGASVHRPHRLEGRRYSLQHTASHCNTLQHTATHMSSYLSPSHTQEVPVYIDRIVEKIVEIPVDRIIEKFVEIPVDRIVETFVDGSNTLQYIATHCNTCWVVISVDCIVEIFVDSSNTPQHTATDLNTLHHTATHIASRSPRIASLNHTLRRDPRGLHRQKTLLMQCSVLLR